MRTNIRILIKLLESDKQMYLYSQVIAIESTFRFCFDKYDLITLLVDNLQLIRFNTNLFIFVYFFF